MRLEIRARRSRKNRKIFTVYLFIFSGILLILFTLFLFFGKTSVMLQEAAQSELESIAFDIIGEVVEKELTSGADYSDIIKIERGSGGKVSSIETDTQKLNLLKLRISNELSDIMLKRTDDVVYVPLGSLTGIDFLTGTGPKLKFDIHWVSGVDSDFSTSFEEAGINQTNYRVMLDFSINVGMMLSGREVGTDVTTSICVAETVIVGDIPKFLSRK